MNGIDDMDYIFENEKTILDDICFWHSIARDGQLPQPKNINSFKDEALVTNFKLNRR